MRADGGWLAPFELRVGLGCMRLSTDPGRDEAVAAATIHAALDGGVTVFDTARAYGLGEDDVGHNERLLAAALAGHPRGGAARVVTKGGMSRRGDAWIPNGRARAIRADCEASLAALAGRAIDLYLLHAPDPRTPFATSLRALARLLEEGLVARVGLSNVTRGQLDEALAALPVAAVETALGPFDDSALRGGLVARCVERGVTVLAHSPLGGPRRGGRLRRDLALARAAAAVGASPAEVALAWIVGLAPDVVALPGARSPEAARSAASAGSLVLDADALAALAERFPAARLVRPRTRPRQAAGGEVVLVMGIPGAGKTRVATRLAERGYRRLNRDERGGTLRGLAATLDELLARGEGRVVVDSTFLARAARAYVVDAAERNGASVRCVFLDTPLAQAQANLVLRLLERHGGLLGPDELRRAAREEPGLLPPTSHLRAARELEPPTPDEGFSSVEVVPFERAPAAKGSGPAVFVAAGAIAARGDGGWALRAGWERALAAADGTAPVLLFDWLPGAGDTELDDLAVQLGRAGRARVRAAVCPHPPGPPVCWCRPPLPGLPLALAHAEGVDPARSVLIGANAAHRALAATLGSRYLTGL